MPQSSLGTATDRMARPTAAEEVRWDRGGRLLLVLGAAIAVLAAAAWFARLRIGSGPVPLWIPLAVNAGIAAGAGALIVLRVVQVSDPPAWDEDAYVLVPKSEWNSPRFSVPDVGAGPRARRRTDGIPAVAPVAGQDKMSPLGLWPPRSTRPNPTPAPATMAPSPDGPVPIGRSPPPGPRKAPGPSPTLPKPLGQLPVPSQLSRREYSEIVHLGEALGIRRGTDESLSEFTKRLVAIAEQTPSDGAKVPATPVRRPDAAPPPVDADRNIDALLKELDELGRPAPDPRTKKER
ncbi:MAG TPA: hypothetical protein VJQ43_06190 [Thermoplasmata archaeon]|nr:hypothetical protein [Thermoplasmata archaeon]